MPDDKLSFDLRGLNRISDVFKNASGRNPFGNAYDKDAFVARDGIYESIAEQNRQRTALLHKEYATPKNVTPVDFASMIPTQSTALALTHPSPTRAYPSPFETAIPHAPLARYGSAQVAPYLENFPRPATAGAGGGARIINTTVGAADDDGRMGRGRGLRGDAPPPKKDCCGEILLSLQKITDILSDIQDMLSDFMGKHQQSRSMQPHKSVVPKDEKPEGGGLLQAIAGVGAAGLIASLAVGAVGRGAAARAGINMTNALDAPRKAFNRFNQRIRNGAKLNKGELEEYNSLQEQLERDKGGVGGFLRGGLGKFARGITGAAILGQGVETGFDVVKYYQDKAAHKDRDAQYDIKRGEQHLEQFGVPFLPSIFGKMGGALGLTGLLEKAGLGGLGKFANPLAAVGIGGAEAYLEVSGEQREIERIQGDNTLTADEKNKQIQAVRSRGNKSVAQIAGGTIGTVAGGAIGATIGSIVPGLGTAIGGVAGSMAGGVAGAALGSFGENLHLGDKMSEFVRIISSAFDPIKKFIEGVQSVLAPFERLGMAIGKFELASVQATFKDFQRGLEDLKRGFGDLQKGLEYLKIGFDAIANSPLGKLIGNVAQPVVKAAEDVTHVTQARQVWDGIVHLVQNSGKTADSWANTLNKATNDMNQQQGQAQPQHVMVAQRTQQAHAAHAVAQAQQSHSSASGNHSTVVNINNPIIRDVADKKDIVNFVTGAVAQHHAKNNQDSYSNANPVQSQATLNAAINPLGLQTFFGS